MKTTKTRKYLSLLMAICMLMNCLMQVSVFAVGTCYHNDLDDEVVNANYELLPLRAGSCPAYVPGIGYVGSGSWNKAIRKVQEGGDILGWGSNDVYLSEEHAVMLIEAAGCQVYGKVERSAPGEPHDYYHIHYMLNNSRHNTIRVKDADYGI